MAVVMRGWSKTASTALKLATAERIIGYQFKDVDKLYEALDRTKQDISLPSGKAVRGRPRNSRLALVGDALGNLQMARDWYDRPSLSGLEWTEIQQSTLSNERLGKVGFKLGLDECAISNEIVRPYDMATTIEALIAAVDMDGASQHQVRKVCLRFGIEHKHLMPAGRLWIWEMVRSKLSLPEKFFIGHHLKLQEGVFETQLNRSPARKKQEIWLWRSARRLWRLTRQLWQPRKEANMKPSSKKKPKRLAYRSATQPPRKAVPAAKGSPSAVRTTTPSVEEPINKAELLSEESIGHQEDIEKAAVPEEMTDTKTLAEGHGVTESSTTKASTSSKPAKTQPRPILAEFTSVIDTQPAETGSQDSNAASNDGAEPAPSSVASTGTEKKVERRSHEASETDPVEGTAGDNSTAQLKEKTKAMWEMAKMLDSAILKIQEAGDDITEKDKSQIETLGKQRQRIVDRRSLIIKKLRRRQRLKES